MFKQLFGRRRMPRKSEIHNQQNPFSSVQNKTIFLSLKENLDTIQTILILKQQILTAYDLETVHLLDEALMAILSGDTLLLLNSLSECIIISSSGWKTRAIEKKM